MSIYDGQKSGEEIKAGLVAVAKGLTNIAEAMSTRPAPVSYTVIVNVPKDTENLTEAIEQAIERVSERERQRQAEKARLLGPG